MGIDPAPICVHGLLCKRHKPHGYEATINWPQTLKMLVSSFSNSNGFGHFAKFYPDIDLAAQNFGFLSAVTNDIQTLFLNFEVTPSQGACLGGGQLSKPPPKSNKLKKSVFFGPKMGLPL